MPPACSWKGCWMPVPNKCTQPHQTHTQLKKKTGQTVAIGCWAQPGQATAQQSTYLQPALFILDCSPFSCKCSSPTHLDASFSHLWSFSCEHGFVPLPFHQPWDSPWSWRRWVPLTVLQVCEIWELFLLFPTADHISKKHQGTICSALLLKYNKKPPWF